MPVANADTATTNQETPVTINVLANDTDADGDSLTAVIASPPTNGTVFINADQTIQYTPALGFSGLDSFTYVADDGADQSTAATVTITVTRRRPPRIERSSWLISASKQTFQYAGQGAALSEQGLAAANRRPMGIATNAAGTRTWVVDKTKKVYVYDDAGAFLGSWMPSGPARSTALRPTARVFGSSTAATTGSGCTMGPPAGRAERGMLTVRSV